MNSLAQSHVTNNPSSKTNRSKSFVDNGLIPFFTLDQQPIREPETSRHQNGSLDCIFKYTICLEEKDARRCIPFAGFVPDYIQGDRSVLCKSKEARRGRQTITDGLLWAIHHEVIIHKCSMVILPDVYLSQIVWGSGYKPANWRQVLTKRLGSQTLERMGHKPNCSQCQMRGSGLAHEHFMCQINSGFLGFLEACCIGVDEEFDRTYDFRRGFNGLPDVQRKEMLEVRRAGGLAPIYFPLELFGPSPRSGLTSAQRGILRGLTKELTRTTGRNGYGRPDRAEVISDGMVPSALCQNRIKCPHLQEGIGYVGFNGNGKKRRGMGYRIVGARGQGWLVRTGTVLPSQTMEIRKSVRAFLSNLASLAGPFGLVVAGLNPRTGEWLPLDRLETLTQSKGGWQWLGACHLRIYASADFLARWRRYFAVKMGFSTIPGGDDNSFPLEPEDGDPAASRANLVRYLTKNGMSQKDLAIALGASQSVINYKFTGKRSWTSAFQARVKGWINEREGGC